MNELVLVAGAAGVALGLFFYGGLWFTVSRLAVARRPVLLALASYWVRTLAVIGVALYFAKRDWLLAVSLLVGIMAGRLMVKLLTRNGGLPIKCT